MKLALGLIATNEERMIKAFLPKLSKLFNGDVVAIDYGSTDKTSEVLDKYCKKVLTMPWPRDFGKAKTNLVKLAEDCGYDWLFLIDADETIDPNYFPLIEQCIKRNDYDCYFLPRFSYVNGGFLDAQIEHFPDFQARLFKLNVGYHYRNIRHCCLYKGNDEATAWELRYGAVLPVTIFHYKGFKPLDIIKLQSADREAAMKGKSLVTKIDPNTKVELEETNRPLLVDLPLDVKID